MSEETNAPADQTNGDGVGKGSYGVAASVVVLITLIGMIMIPVNVKKRNTSQQNACVGNLRIIDSGKEQSAMAYRLTDGDTVASTSVNEYVKGNTTPICPGGGAYTYNKIGEQPTCTVVEPTLHQLP